MVRRFLILPITRLNHSLDFRRLQKKKGNRSYYILLPELKAIPFIFHPLITSMLCKESVGKVESWPDFE
jgi:hypothetical protein